MATIVIRKQVDDLDNSEDGVATTALAFEGVQYEIDLSQSNYNRLREFLDPYLASARRMGGRATPRKVSIPGAPTESVTRVNGPNPQDTRNYLTGLAAPANTNHNTLIRIWYNAQDPITQARLGVLHPKGAIRESIRRAYLAAHARGEAESAGSDAPASNGNGNGHGGYPAATVQFIAEPEPTVTEIPPTGTTENAIIRAWYRDQPYPWRADHPMADRGRVPAPIREAWKEAQQDA